MTLEELIEKLPQHIKVNRYIFILEFQKVAGKCWLVGYGNILGIMLPTIENDLTDAVSKLNAKVQQYQKGDLDICQPEHYIARGDILSYTLKQSQQ